MNTAYSLFTPLPMAPSDPILGITEAFLKDTNPNKVNLGVGIYYDDNGKLPLLECVQQAEAEWVSQRPARGYLMSDGMPDFQKAVQAMVFGENHTLLQQQRVVTIQSLGGSGALKVGADLFKLINPQGTVYISDPSWENHRAIFEAAGFTVQTYPYYDASQSSVNFAAMTAVLETIPAGSMIILHACCHNPTGADLTPAQWQDVIRIVRTRGLVPFLDMAYQGFADGLQEDSQVIRDFAATEGPLFLATSFSKSFSFYGERVGSFSVLTENAEQSKRLMSHIKRVIRVNYSNPPMAGARTVTKVLTTPALRTLWENELKQMRERIAQMRHTLANQLRAHHPGQDFSFVERQRGMFSYSGLSRDQVLRLRDEFSIYAVETGRICVAALNSHNIGYVANAVAQVWQTQQVTV